MTQPSPRLKRNLVIAALGLASALTLGTAAQAATVVHQAVNAVVNVGGTASNSNITHTYNQSGLNVGYISGMTPWAPYTTTTAHSTNYADEWFALPQAAFPTSASVTYDLGVLAKVMGLALWNEDWAGIGTVVISFGDANGVFGGPFATMTPFDNPFGATPYLASVLNFNNAPAGTRYVKLKMTGCPQFTPGVPRYDGCSLGEVAFGVDDASITAIPEPGALALAGIACVAMGAVRRRDPASGRPELDLAHPVTE